MIIWCRYGGVGFALRRNPEERTVFLITTRGRQQSFQRVPT